MSGAISLRTGAAHRTAIPPSPALPETAGFHRRAFTVARRPRLQGFAVAILLTRSRRSRCVQPAHGARAASGNAPASSAFRRAFVAARRWPYTSNLN
ncbi:hypothetical protein [Mangrovibacter phragmitis]|uniref:hypothetical protein n=1 Tax=Mangrovibacter phragmitis TaxID=1691903 RepID=UPI0035125540